MNLNSVETGILIVVGSLASVFLLPDFAPAQTGDKQESRWGNADSKSLILTRRTDNNAYGTSAISFQTESQDVGVHRNYVDLVFNGCGLLHINPVGGMQSRIADLGVAELDVTLDEDKERVWASNAFPPEAGHVYWLEIEYLSRSQTVKFRVDQLERDQMAISWAFVKNPEGAAAPSGMAGTMGQCGGQHVAR